MRYVFTYSALLMCIYCTCSAWFLDGRPSKTFCVAIIAQMDLNFQYSLGKVHDFNQHMVYSNIIVANFMKKIMHMYVV